MLARKFIFMTILGDHPTLLFSLAQSFWAASILFFVSCFWLFGPRSFRFAFFRESKNGRWDEESRSGFGSAARFNLQNSFCSRHFVHHHCLHHQGVRQETRFIRGTKRNYSSLSSKFEILVGREECAVLHFRIHFSRIIWRINRVFNFRFAALAFVLALLQSFAPMDFDLQG